MEIEKKGRPLLLCLLLLGSLSAYVVTPVMSRTIDGAGDLGEQKNYYPPDHAHHGSSPGRAHTPSCPTPSQGGGRSGAAPTYRPPAPSHGGGGYYNPPSTPSVTTPPTGPVTPITPSPLVPLVPPSPATPIFPVFPTPPGVPFDPNSLPFTCDFWRTHPGLIWSLFGYWCNIGQLFGPVATSLLGSNMNVLDALSNPRTDGFGALYREGTASLLNSMASRTFVYTPQQVRNAFTAALVSDGAAATQAQVFRKANEGHTKHT